MNYFIDFEAQQYTSEIIQIGCVREDGATFVSLVNPGEKHRKLSRFIKGLTGISQEDLDNAPTVDEVFSQFFDWLAEDGNSIRFYCYGNSDTDFARASLKLATSIKAQAAISLIMCKISDYSLTIKNHFGLASIPSLIKVARYFTQNEELEQTHAALDDAELLRQIYLGVQRNEPIDDAVFANYKTVNPVSEFENIEGYVINRYDGEECLDTANSLTEAVDKFHAYIKKCYPKSVIAEKKAMRKKIIACLKSKETYYGYEWKLVAKNG